MKQTHAIDECSAIMIAGLRMITKAEYINRHDTSDDRFYLEYEYKGLSKRVAYKTKKARDDMFEKVTSMLNPSEQNK